MESYQEVVAKIAELQRQAEDLKKQERKTVIKELRAKIAEFGLTAADLGLTGKQATAKAPSTVKAKYRNPATGETWSGRGIAPRWLQEAERTGKSRDSFLI